MRRYRVFQAIFVGAFGTLGVMRLLSGGVHGEFGYGYLLIAACYAWTLKRGLALDDRLAAMRAQGLLPPAGGGGDAARSDGPTCSR